MITNDVKLHLESIGVFPKSQKHPKPKAIIVLGTSGSGKSTQCKTISAKFGFVHISSGALIREHMACGGAHAEMFAEYTRLGKLVPSEYVVKLVKTAFENQSW